MRFGIYKLGELGEVSFGMLNLGELIFRIFMLGESKFGSYARKFKLVILEALAVTVFPART